MSEKRLSLLTQLHEFEGREAVMIFVVHDLNPRALSPKVPHLLSWICPQQSTLCARAELDMTT